MGINFGSCKKKKTLPFWSAMCRLFFLAFCFILLRNLFNFTVDLINGYKLCRNYVKNVISSYRYLYYKLFRRFCRKIWGLRICYRQCGWLWILLTKFLYLLSSSIQNIFRMPSSRILAVSSLTSLFASVALITPLLETKKETFSHLDISRGLCNFPRRYNLASNFNDNLGNIVQLEY